MAQAFSCPKCGAPQDYSGSGDTIKCPYCETTIIVPDELRRRSAAPASADQPVGDWVRQANALVEIKRRVQAGNQLDAIKLYRETFNVGLDQARDAVEAIGRGENVQLAQVTIGSPETIQIEPGGGEIRIDRTPGGGINITTPRAARVNPRTLGCIVAVIVFMVVVAVVVPLAATGIGLFAAFGAVSQVPTPVEIDFGTPIAALTQTPAARQTATPAPTPSPTPGFARILSSFGAEGIGAGKFKDARSIALDASGILYVGEYTGGRVQRFDASGKFLSLWNVDAKMPLRGLAADRRGSVYTVQGGAITRYNGESGARLGTVKLPGGEGFDMVAAAPDGTLWATWYEQRTGVITSTEGHRDDLVHFDSNGKVLQRIQGAISEQTGDAEVDNQIAVDGLGNLYVLGGTFDHGVFKFSREGKFVNRFGSRGDAPGQFNSPGAIAVDGKGRIFVGDGVNVLVFAPDGRYLDRFRVEGGASGMVFDDQDHLWIAARTRVFQFEPNE